MLCESNNNYDGKTIGIIDASTDSKSREQHTLA